MGKKCSKPPTRFDRACWGQHDLIQNPTMGRSLIHPAATASSLTLTSPNNMHVESTKLWNKSLEIHGFLWINMTNTLHTNIHKRNLRSSGVRLFLRVETALHPSKLSPCLLAESEIMPGWDIIQVLR